MVIFIFFKCKKWQSALQKRVLNNYESRLFPFKKVSFHILHKTGRNPCNELCVTSARAAPPLHKYPFCTHYILEQLLICKNHRSNLNSYELYYWRSNTTLEVKIFLFLPLSERFVYLNFVNTCTRNKASALVYLFFNDFAPLYLN